MPNKIINLLKEKDVELTEDLTAEIEKIWKDEKVPNNDDLFTQEDVNDIVGKRVAQEQKVWKGQLESLQKEMEGLIDPSKIEEYQTQISELNGKLDEIKKNTAKDYELKIAGTKSGVTDEDYFDFLITKNKLKDRLIAQINDDGEVEVFATDTEGNILTEDGKKLGPEALVNEFKESKPDLFENKKPGRAGGGGGNPQPGSDLSSEELKEKTSDFAKQMGYKN